MCLWANKNPKATFPIQIACNKSVHSRPHTVYCHYVPIFQQSVLQAYVCSFNAVYTNFNIKPIERPLPRDFPLHIVCSKVFTILPYLIDLFHSLDHNGSQDSTEGNDYWIVTSCHTYCLKLHVKGLCGSLAETVIRISVDPFRVYSHVADLMQKFLLLSISSIHLKGIVLGVNAWISANPILVNGTNLPRANIPLWGMLQISGMQVYRGRFFFIW